jgi:hypothetical protein
MNSPNLKHSQRAAPDALFDHIEQDLLALTTAPLDEEDHVPSQSVDEFAPEFLIQWSMPRR